MIAFFTVPNEYDPQEPADVLWTQPEDSQVFASFREDVPASKSLFASAAVYARQARGTATATSSVSATPSVTPSAASSPLSIAARTASQSICAG